MDSDRLEHARHNLEVCEFLKKHTEYRDWIITTAFYSAVHFVEGASFPLELKNLGIKAQTFQQFLALTKNRQGFGNNSHKKRHYVVRHQLPQIAGSYGRLYNLCSTARYRKYDMSEHERDAAVNFLTAIRTCCDKVGSVKK